MKRLAVILIIGCSVFLAATGFCDENRYVTNYATFEEAAAASAATKPTKEMIISKVNAACDMLQAEGITAGFEQLKDPNGGYAFAGTYIWVHDSKNVMRMHPIKTALDGQNLMNFKDAAGSRFFIQMSIVAMKKGSGWVGYMWPKPGEKMASKKVSLVKKCTVEGEDLILGCGAYDLNVSDMDMQ